jgi:shikimate dehydrogenase
VKKRFRKGDAPMIDTQTRLFGVIGNPVRHSLGPLMHNCALQAMGCPALLLRSREVMPNRFKKA